MCLPGEVASAQGRRGGARGGQGDSTPAETAATSDGNYIKANYTKYEHRIPMRDGARLHTAVYVPKDTSQQYPILMTRTPYSCRPYGIDQYPNSVGPSDQFMREKYIFVTQDVRGCWMSEGEFVDIRPHNPHKQGPKDIDEASDTYDTIEWLVKNVPGNNGRVGQLGISYPGFYTAAGMIDAHPALKASSPQAPLVDWFIGDDWHHNGALLLSHGFNFLVNFGQPRPEPRKRNPAPRFEHGTQDGYKFFLDMGPLREAEPKYMKGNVEFWKDIMQHPNYDEFWQARNLRPHMKNIKPAVMTVGGWYDAEDLFGTLETYKYVERLSPECENTVVMGPWVHGGWSRGQGDALGDVSFNAPTSEYYREKIQFPFFQHYLKDRGEATRPEAWMFQTGINQWFEYDAWPPKGADVKDVYLSAGGKLSFERSAAPRNSDPGYDEYVSDPKRPVPTMEGTALGMPREYMTADQRYAARRPDVLVYQTDELEGDLVVAGPLEVELYVSTSGTDSDWVVKVIDVYPNDMGGQDAGAGGGGGAAAAANPRGVQLGGYQQLVRGDVFRGKFRNSFEKPEPFVPNQPTLVKFTMPDICHAFRPGHRLMVQIQSSWFPLIDRNPQTFVNIHTAGPEDFVTARQRIYRDETHATRLRMPVVP
jgi:putative CocE/NonD family hydrolase